MLNAAQANCFVFVLMSSDVPSKLPRYLLVFQIWSDVLLMLYSSVLSALMIRFLFVRIFVLFKNLGTFLDHARAQFKGHKLSSTVRK